MRQIFGEDAVLGRRIGGGAEADDGVGKQRVGMSKNIIAQPMILIVLLMNITAPFRHRIGEGADESGQRDVGDGEKVFSNGSYAAGACISRRAAMATIR